MPGQTVDYDIQEPEEDYGLLSNKEPARKEHKKSSIVGGAALAGTAAGLIIAGPLVAVISGVAVATLATQDTKAGKVAQSTGDTVLCAQDQIRDLDKKFRIVEKTKMGVGSLVRNVKKMTSKCHLSSCCQN